MEQITENQFEDYAKKLKEPKWAFQSRERSFRRMQSSPYPPSRYGLNISIAPYGFDFSSVMPQDPGKPESGRMLVKHSSKDKIEIVQGNNLGILEQSGNDALELWKPIIENLGADKTQQHKLSHFHDAFANSFLFIRIPKFAELESPIEIFQEIGEGQTLSDIFVLAEKGAKASLLLYKVSKNAGSQKNAMAYHSEKIALIAHDSSSVEFVSIQDLSREIVQVLDRIAVAGKDASVTWTDVCIGSSYTRMDIENRLCGEGAQGNIKVLFLGAGTQRLDINTKSIHAAPRTVSDILTKGVLNGEAKALSRGLVRIEADASGSNGYEKQDALLLSEMAEADAIPNLEINNNDVRCTHGSTVGQLDKEKLFYLRSRGMDEESAKKLLVEGYFNPVLDMFKNKNISKKVHEAILKAID
ncbi:Fe-S cluster assembly protein SufD [Candidatus Woesearchaeota archaeon]|nr:Fe-S cluster assembly protein SufD [Candidatus Woesearchaeota archaeon]